MAIRYLDVKDVEIICIELKNFLTHYKDPPPQFKNSNFDKVESILSTPKRTFDKKDLYPGIYSKAACYLYFINKLHPFENGNKRISIVSTGVFLLENGFELTADQDKMYHFAKEVTISHDKQDNEFKAVVNQNIFRK